MNILKLFQWFCCGLIVTHYSSVFVCFAASEPESSWTPFAADTNLQYQIAMTKKEYILGEPLPCRLLLRNRANLPYSVTFPWDDGRRGISIKIQGKEKVKRSGLVDGMSLGLLIMPNQLAVQTYFLNKLCDSDSPGMFDAKIVLQIGCWPNSNGVVHKHSEISAPLHFLLMPTCENKLKEFVSEFAEGLVSTNSELAEYTANYFSVIKADSVRPYLIGGLSNKNDKVARICAEGLMQHHQKFLGTNVLTMIYSSGVSLEAKRVLIQEACEGKQLKQDELRDLCEKVIKDNQSWTMTVNALRVLKRTGVGKLQNVVASVTNDPSPMVRASAKDLLDAGKGKGLKARIEEELQREVSSQGQAY